MDYFFNPLSTTHPSYVKDTGDIIEKGPHTFPPTRLLSIYDGRRQPVYQYRHRPSEIFSPNTLTLCSQTTTFLNSSGSIWNVTISSSMVNITSRPKARSWANNFPRLMPTSTWQIAQMPKESHPLTQSLRTFSGPLIPTTSHQTQGNHP